MRAMHGAIVADADGRALRVFAPPWWRVDLWFRWAFTRGKERIVVACYGGDVAVRGIYVGMIGKLNDSKWWTKAGQTEGRSR